MKSMLTGTICVALTVGATVGAAAHAGTAGWPKVGPPPCARTAGYPPSLRFASGPSVLCIVRPVSS